MVVASTSFPNKFRILLYDARGQGQSDLGQANLPLEGHVDALIELLGHLGVNRAHGPFGGPTPGHPFYAI